MLQYNKRKNRQAKKMTDSEENTSPKTGLMLGAALVVVIGGLATWSLLKEQPEPEPVAAIKPLVVQKQPEPVVEPDPEPELPPVAVVTPDPEPIEESEPEPAPIIPKIVLPSLQSSDAPVFKELTDMSWHHDFAALFVNKDIIRRFVIFVDNMASGTIAREFSSFKPPVSRFKVIDEGSQSYIDQSSFERYDVYMAIISSTEPEDMIKLYNKYKPLVKQVYDDIGYPDHDFTDTLLQAIDHVLETPVVDGRIELVSPKVMYDYKNEQWQSLTHVQKQVMRLGAQNINKLKPLLRRYRGLLAQ
jgi:hypothetical protein